VRPALTIGLLLTVSMAAFEAMAIATVLPETLREIGGLEWYGWVFSAFMLANLVGIPLAGEAADRRPDWAFRWPSVYCSVSRHSPAPFG
jgi:MFS family permease